MNLFVYGTLLVPKIFEAVTGVDDFESVPGTLDGHGVRRVEGADFPGIARRDESVTGRVFLDLDERTMNRLDAYEDAFYRRELVEVATEEGGIEAFAYIVPEKFAEQILSEEKWTLEWFENNALDRYWNRLFE